MSVAEPILLRACPESDVRDRQLTYVESGGKNYLITRVDGEIRAYRNLCRHQFLVMEGCDVDEDSFMCPYHTVRYFLATGDVKDDSGFMGIDALTRYDVRLEDGWVILEIPADERT